MGPIYPSDAQTAATRLLDAVDKLLQLKEMSKAFEHSGGSYSTEQAALREVYRSGKEPAWEELRAAYMEAAAIGPRFITPYFTSEDLRGYNLLSTLEAQEGGTHYKVRAIQPVQYWHANKLDAFQGAVVKYVTRHREKNGLQDLKKAIHYLQIYIELEHGVRSKIEYDEGKKF